MSGFAHTVIANPDNRGVAAGNNQGIVEALKDGCEYILLLNNDVVFGPELFSRLVSGLAEHQCDMTTPVMYYYQPSDVIWCAGGELLPHLALLNTHGGENKKMSAEFSKAKPATYAPTCCTLIRREVFGKVGLMDERYFVYSDDVDFMIRCWRAGLVMYYLPQAELWHKVNSLTGTDSPFSISYGWRNRAFLISKHCKPYEVTLFNLLYPIYFVVRWLLRKDDTLTTQRKLSAWKIGSRMLSSS